MSMVSRRGTRAIALAVAVGVAAQACGDGPAEPTTGVGDIPILLSTTNTALSTIVIEVTAADIPEPLVFNFEFVNGTAAGTIQIPAGQNRTITARAFDDAGSETHRGVVTITVVSGANPPITLVLQPLLGDQPITLLLGDFTGFTLTVSPTAAAIDVLDYVQIDATVFDANGVPFFDPPAVSWATTNPAFASAAGGFGPRTGFAGGVAPGTANMVGVWNGLAAAASVTVNAAPVADEIEPNDDITQATSFSERRVHGAISVAGDADYSAYFFFAGTQLDIRVNARTLGSPLDPTVTVYDFAGTQLGFDDDGGPGFDSQLLLSVPADGVFYIAVRGFADLSTGPYGLVVRLGPPLADVMEIEPNDDVTTAAPVPLGLLAGGEISPAGDSDFWAFTATAGQTLVLEGRAQIYGSTLDPMVFLHDSFGMQLASDDDGGPGLDSRLEFTFAASGTYYAVVRGFGTTTGFYRLSIQDPMMGAAVQPAAPLAPVWLEAGKAPEP